MKPEYTYLDRLTNKSKAYKVKVKIIEKGRPQVSPNKGTRYQSLVLADEKGNRIRGALFGDDIDAYENVLQHKGEYEIANAPIKQAPDAYKNKGLYQISFGGQTIIQPINVEPGLVLPSFQSIASIPRAGPPDQTYDVLGIVLYIEEEARKVGGTEDHVYSVREIVVTDHSTEQPLIISAWNDLASSKCEVFSSWTEKFLVIGFTALRVSNHKGFSLSSSMSTVITHAPQGERAEALKKWAAEHKNILAHRRSRVLEVRNPSKQRVITTIEQLKRKTAATTLQEERHWLEVTIPEPELQLVITYLGCSKCGRRGDMPTGEIYACTNCSSVESISVPRVAFRFEASDGTGTLQLTAFNEDSAKISGIPASEMYRIKHDGDAKAFAKIKKKLQTQPFTTQVGPATSLARNNVLTWVLKMVADGENSA